MALANSQEEADRAGYLRGLYMNDNASARINNKRNTHSKKELTKKELSRTSGGATGLRPLGDRVVIKP